MTCIAVTVADGCSADPARVAAWCEAVDKQAREFADAWRVEYTPVLFFSGDVLTKLKGKALKDFTSDARLLTIEDDVGDPGALGYHDDVAGVIFARVMFQGEPTSITLSHEVLEEMGDPTCDAWVDIGGGRQQALEACDRVEGDNYILDGVAVSNYLLPSAFDGSAGPWDKLGVLKHWDGMSGGGYMIVRAEDGTVTDVFAETKHAKATVATKRARPDSRLARRLGAFADPAVRPELEAALR